MDSFSLWHVVHPCFFYNDSGELITVLRYGVATSQGRMALALLQNFVQALERLKEII